MNEYYVILDFEDAKDILTSIHNAKPKYLAIDIETNSLDERKGDILGIGFSWEIHTGIYIPFMVRDIGLFVGELHKKWSDEEEGILTNLISKILLDNNIEKVAHNAQFELLWFVEKLGIPFNINIFCTYWANFIEYPDTSPGYEHNNLSLDAIIKKRYNDLSYLKGIWDGIPSDKEGNKDLSLYKTTQQIGEYCCGDCDVALRERLRLEKEFIGKPYIKLLKTRYMSEVSFVARMHRTGLRVDIDYLRRKRKELLLEKSELLNKIQYVVKDLRFNPASDLALRNYFFNKLKMKKLNGNHLDDSVLSSYRDKEGVSVAGDILEYRRLVKLISTYFDNIERNMNPITGKVHSNIKLTGTVTGRMSIQDPPLQTLPVRDARSKIVKKIFIPDEGYCFVGGDYSQIELRLIALYSQDPMLLKAYLEDIDVHSLTAAGIYGIDVSKVTKAQRRLGKGSNFAFCYGGSYLTLIRSMGNYIMGPEYAKKKGVEYDDLSKLDIPYSLLESKSKEIRANYFKTYKRILPYNDSVITEARKKGYVVTDYGWVRYIPDIGSSDDRARSHAEKQAVNSRPQGTAGQYLKYHFMDIIEETDRQNLKADPILNVHDQMVIHCPIESAEKVKTLMCEIGVRKDESDLDIPMKIDPEIGYNNLLEV